MRISDWSSDVCSSDLMDGRTDIKWYDSIRFRLAEKAQRLARYISALEAIDPAHRLLGILRPASAYTEARVSDFTVELSVPENLSTAANRLTADDPAKLLSLAPLIAALEEEAKAADGAHAVALKTLAAARSEEHTSELQSLMRSSYAV